MFHDKGAPRAHSLVCEAVKKGILPKIVEGVKCVDCGNQARYYDHRDYNKPLDVEPVCHNCNYKRGPAIPNTSYKPKPRYRPDINHTPEKVVKLPTLFCLRCGHKWHPRTPDKPVRCGKCKSPHWSRTPRSPAQERVK